MSVRPVVRPHTDLRPVGLHMAGATLMTLAGRFVEVEGGDRTTVIQ